MRLAVTPADIERLAFQSTHLREVRHGIPNLFSPSAAFQSTHLREVRPSSLNMARSNILFQSTHLREVRHTMIFFVIQHIMFQSTHLREVRLVRELRQFGRHGFNPRTYERCDNADTRLQQVVKRFNPRTYERCDIARILTVQPYSCFNPRTYERCDPELMNQEGICIVSIHAPTRGATTKPLLLWSSDRFQSTHLREVRLSCRKIRKCQSVSIHAPTRGATYRFGEKHRHSAVSIHAPTRGATESSAHIDSKR